MVKNQKEKRLQHNTAKSKQETLNLIIEKSSENFSKISKIEKISKNLEKNDSDTNAKNLIIGNLTNFNKLVEEEKQEENNSINEETFEENGKQLSILEIENKKLEAMIKDNRAENEKINDTLQEKKSNFRLN